MGFCLDKDEVNTMFHANNVSILLFLSLNLVFVYL